MPMRLVTAPAAAWVLYERIHDAQETSVGSQSVELDVALDFRLARELRRQCM
jgi:hypothetical protein